MIKWPIFIFFSTCCTALVAQSINGNLRINPTLSYEINKKLKTEFDYRLSFQDNISTFRSSHYQTGLTYKIWKPLRVELVYRYTDTKKWDSHRFMVSLSYKRKFERFSLTSRSRWQFSTVYFDPHFMNEVRAPRVYLRQKFAIDYPIPNTKTTVFAAGELFFRVQPSSVYFHRMRYQIGVEQELKLGNSIGLRLIYENRVDPSRQDRLILTAKYDLSIDTMIKKIKKKKKKKVKKAAKEQNNSENIVNP